MRILILSSEFPPGPGGIGTHAWQLAKCFAEQAHAVIVLSPQDYVEPAERDAFNHGQPFQIVTLKRGRTALGKALYRASMLRKSIRQFKPEVIVVSGGRSIWLSALAIPQGQFPWVIVGHGTEFGSQNPFKAWLTRVSANRASALIGVSEFTLETVHRMGIHKPAAFVIHNGADAQQYQQLPETERRALRQHYQVEHSFVLLTVGNVSDRKGQETVICALPGIREQLPEVIYWMAGLPQKKVELEALARQLGVADAIRFLGRVSNEELCGLYNACDLFTMTSRQLADGDFEGYGIAVIEAAMCGKPAIVTDNSGLAEAVSDGVTGLLVPQNDAQALVEAVLRLAADPALRHTLGAQALQRATTEGTWKKVSQKYLAILTQLVEAGRQQHG